jgi:1-acyl-sn-glycerol-3-phosphate acyltransferase
MPGLDKDEFMARLESDIETRSIALLDLENLGALNPDDIGKTEENDVARAKREAREAAGEK